MRCVYAAYGKPHIVEEGEMEKTVLLVEDNADIVAINREAFELEGYTIYVAYTLEEAWGHIQVECVHLILLDVMLPDGSGVEFCLKLRKAGYTTPILFLTALGEKQNVIEAIRSGGDDYLCKPYDLDELLVRAAALLRRAQWHQPNHSDGIQTYGPLTIDAVAMKAFLHGEDAMLTAREFALLTYLLKRRGEFIRVDELYEAVWQTKAQDAAATIRVHVNRLRTKLCLHESSGVQIDNKYRMGYRIWV